MDNFDLDFTRPPADLDKLAKLTDNFIEKLSASDKIATKNQELRTLLRARRAARKIHQTAVDQEALAQLKKNIHRWGWYPAIRNAMKRGVSIEVAIAAHALKPKEQA